MGKESSKKLDGSCLCGAVKFEVTTPSLSCFHCHCSICRRAYGAAFGTLTGFESKNLRITSSPDNLTRYRTESDAARSFCKNCGSTLFYESPHAEGEVYVTLANIGGELDRQPDKHYFVDHKAKWFSITDSLPQYGGESGDEPKK